MMSPTPASLALLLTLVASPAPSWALSCAWGPVAALPPSGEVDVPTNVVLRVVYYEATPEQVPLALIGPGEQVVEVSWERVSAGGAGETVYAITPAAALEPDQTYRLVSEDEGGWVFTTFTTGDGPLTTAPAAPVILDAYRDAGSSEWGPWRYHNLLVQPPDRPVFYEVDVSSDSDFSQLKTVQLQPHRGDDEDTVGVGSGVCGGNTRLEPSERWLRARAIDMAGNVSPTSEPARASGCSAVAAPVSVGLGLFALGLIGLRRRR